MIEYIISGGQSGADQAGLYVGKKLDFQVGGFAPKNFMTSDGPNPELLRDTFNLQEKEGGYQFRTHENVRVSTGTIRCAVDFFTPGEICTKNAIKKFDTPWFDIYLLNPPSTDKFVMWLFKNRIKILNVAGNTQGTRGFDIHKMTYNYLLRGLHKYKRIISEMR